MYRVIDFIVAISTIVVAPLLKILSGPAQRLPLARKIQDYFGISVIRHHYYSPMVTPADLIAPLDVPRGLPGLDMNLTAQLILVQQLRYSDELAQIPITGSSRETFSFQNGQFEYGDAECFYSVIRHFKPKKIVEIGCGQSTLIAQLAEAKNASENPAHTCEHICIEPFENSWLEKTGATVIRQRVEKLDATLIEALEENDILFIDSSHMIRPQGDVLHECLGLLPVLNPGVLVHIHDIFTPRDYPEKWVIGDRRLWNEQYLLEAFLCFNSEFSVILAANFLAHGHRSQISEAFPLLSKSTFHEPGSFWIQRRSPRKERAS
ncbi:MAG TPA: class I SAM-dependent methyltransferase [Rhizomicrobium sp.]|jgi:hypothetical protein|nr:class I SAM-dependent methyltransferase [Rhizomicrobium sp.]